MQETSLVLTTNPGLESLAFEELRERAAAAGVDDSTLRRLDSGIRGRLLVRAPIESDTLIAVARRMHSVHHLLHPLRAFQLPERDGLDVLAAELASLDIPGLDASKKFRVTAQRRGCHDFTSQDVERLAGAEIQRRFGASVDLVHFDVEVEVAVVDRLCAIGLRLTRGALSKRLPRVYNARAALRANVAYAALRMAGIGSGTRRLLDPFCGSGTILMEAGALVPGLELWGSDWRESALEGARRNLQAAGLADRCRLQVADARDLAEAYPVESFDAIVTNPPYGKRIGRAVHFVGFYRHLLPQMHAVLAPGGRLTLLAHKRGAFRVAVERSEGFRIREQRVVEMSSLHPGIFVLERL